MGPVAALVYLGFLDAEKADTAGKARAYIGAVPGKGLKAGQKVRFNPLAKGRGRPQASGCPPKCGSSHATPSWRRTRIITHYTWRMLEGELL